MKMLVAAIALAFAAAAAPVIGPVQPAKAQGYSQDQTIPKKMKKAKKAKIGKRAPRSRSPYSTNPAHDVYVNGNYAGSDPDPRIRATLRKEYCEDSLDGCGR